MEADCRAVAYELVSPALEPGSPALQLRNAVPADAEEIAAVLAAAFPSLYRGTFGRMSNDAIASLLKDLYDVGSLSLDDTRVCDWDGRVVGVMILHTGRSIGRGTMASFWSLLRRRYGLVRTPRIFFGGIMANLMLDRRIPRAPDLVYIEALAVSEVRRGQGIGSRLLADAEQWARSHGRSRMALHVLASNAGARRLYHRVGFRPWHEPAAKVRFAQSTSTPPWGAILLARRLDSEP